MNEWSLLSCDLTYESSCPEIQTEAINLSLAWLTNQYKGCQLLHTTGQYRWMCLCNIIVKMENCFYIVLNHKGIFHGGLGRLKTLCPFMYDNEFGLSVA